VVGDSPPEAYLVVTTEAGQREVHRVDRPSMTLGRAVDVDLPLTSPRVSRRHAQLTWDGERFVVEDLGSKNGTRINGTPVAGPTPIADGDTLELADCRLEFQTSAPTVTVVLAPGTGSLSVDLSTHEVRVRGEVVTLTPKEYRLLALLYRRAGTVVSHEEIGAAVWPELAGVVSEESIAQLVTRLRRKVEKEAGNPQYVLTVRGFGYRLDLGEQGKD
jgi:pSer/pThr/pTyr-binding forkhead associated (FHA) protein